MPTESMTPEERWQAVFRRQKPDRVPLDYWATPEFDARLMAHLGCAERSEALRKLHVDYVVSPKPVYAGPALPPHTDIFGCRYGDVDYGTGIYDECVGHPLAAFASVEEIEKNYVWPSPDWWDYRSLPAQLEGREGYPVRGGGSEPFLTYKYLRGDERALMDLIEQPEIAQYCLGRLFHLEYENTRRIFERIPGRITYSYIAEDLGGQTDLMFSVRHIREFLLPGMKALVARVAGPRARHGQKRKQRDCPLQITYSGPFRGKRGFQGAERRALHSQRAPFVHTITAELVELDVRRLQQLFAIMGSGSIGDLLVEFLHVILRERLFHARRNIGEALQLFAIVRSIYRTQPEQRSRG